MTDPKPTPPTEQQLASTIYDSICAFQLTAQYASLQHAQMRQYLAEHLAAALGAECVTRTQAADEVVAWSGQQIGVHVPTVDAIAAMLREQSADEVSHVVTDDSDDPEHVDDCPGCEAFGLTGHQPVGELPAAEGAQR
ncbi:hypothetical protein ACGFS9_02940 [Streptomyces sp. NPDC048566]|uniref:hypothetical protein n=1 Tax=Streptomyces sp. NPDC048566 TaxID=3365569 RepID=UPI00371FA992